MHVEAGRVKFPGFSIFFVLFVLIAQLAPGCGANQEQPALFSVSELTLEPKSPLTGELFRISVMVSNTGGSKASYEVNLIIHKYLSHQQPDILETKTFDRTVAVAAGESYYVVFDSLSLNEGIYQARIEDLESDFEVGC